MEQPSSNSSKVTVEYHDPFNVYQLLKPALLQRVPLRNLHWESHAGPLRSIDTLHVDLVPAPDNAAPPSSTENLTLSRVKSSESTASGDDGFRTQPLGQNGAEKERQGSFSSSSKPVRERRHQIPGLRQTPYLKVFLLRCDDNDTYKAQTRRQVREWIKEHTTPQSTSKGTASENHDAFEWLIIHVVVPNTAAATQPRTNGKSSESASSIAADKISSKWKVGGSYTIFEKLRADFNASSKSSFDRIAQIRIGVNDVPYDILPRVVPAIPGSYTESAQDNDNAWIDLIAKFKSLILASFDTRVAQYEEDIKEKDSQRKLPGWNFCTFFVLKEGLARGFESVGLVEDALVGYDELSVGLDTILTGLSSSTAQHSSPFLPFTEDLRRKIESIKGLSQNGGETTVEELDGPIDMQSSGNQGEDDEIPLSASKKNYRELILSNNISVFEIRCYLFARQLTLLLRLGNAWSSREELLAKLREQRESTLQGVAARPYIPEPTESIENMLMLSEICRRSLEFVALIARIMREDILASQGESREDVERDPEMLQLIDNVVASFTFSVAQQILAQTSTKSLPIPPSTYIPASGSSQNGYEQKASIPEPKTMMHPARNSSLSMLSPPSGAVQGLPERRVASTSALEAKSEQTINFSKDGIEELAAHRADLYVLSRSILEKLGSRFGWPVGWHLVEDFEDELLDDMEEIDLDDKSSEQKNPYVDKVVPASLYGVDSKLLRTALDNNEDFYRLYETFTDKSLRHYSVGSRWQAAQANLAELAVLKFYLKDYAAAASYFYRMTPFYADGGWEHIEMCSLVLYAKCLRELDRKEEYVRVVSKLLLKKASLEKGKLLQKSNARAGQQRSLDPHNRSTDDLGELLRTVEFLGKELLIPLTNWFGEVEIEDGPQYCNGEDSFLLGIRLRYLLHEEFTIDKVQIRMLKIYDGPSRSIWLENDSPLVCKGRTVRFRVKSNTIIPGNYIVDHVIFKAQKIKLEYKTTGPYEGICGPFLKFPRMLLHQQAEAFDVRLLATKYIHLDRHRSLEIELSSGWNDISSGEIHFKAGTAGLRLRTSECEVVDGQLDIQTKLETGVVRFNALPARSVVRLRFSFNLEHEVHEIAVRMDASYTTDKGTFSFATDQALSIMLPLGVNVQDIFKHSALFSKFTVTSASLSPLRLLSSTLQSSELFEVHQSGDLHNPVMVFPRQPASLVYKITPKSCKGNIPPGGLQKEQRALALVVNYVCLEEEINNAIKEKLAGALRESSLRQYERLIAAAFISRFHKQAEPRDMERAALLESVSTGILAQTRWKEYFIGLGRLKGSSQDTATLIAHWLQKFVSENPSIPLLPVTSILETERRSIIIPVEIPNMTVVHTADLVLSKPLATSSALGTSFAAINEPLSVTLLVKWSRIWDLQSENSPGSSQTPEPEFMEFIYELTSPQDIWLFGGRRKGQFRIPSKKPAPDSDPKSNQLEFPILLIPLKEGYLPYPNVDIKPASVGRDGGAEGVEASINMITCEIDFKNSAETVRVVADMKSTTVSLDASGPNGGAWLLESERR